MKKFLTISVLFFLILSFVPASGSASLISIPLDTAFSEYGPGESGYIANYGYVTINDSVGEEGKVRFIISLNTDILRNGAYVSKFYFNTTTDFGNNLTLTSDSATLSYAFNNDTNSLYKPDGDGYFDGVINFGTEESTLTFDLFGTNLDKTDFLAQSFGGDKGHFTIAAHIQSTDIGYVGGNPVPIPSTILLLGAGLVGLAGLRRKKQ